MMGSDHAQCTEVAILYISLPAYICEISLQPDAAAVCGRDASATLTYQRDATRGLQFYEEVPASQPADDACGHPMMHQSAMRQATGEAIYCDDVPSYKGMERRGTTGE